ncbi:MAG: peptide deformylase [Actinobacteria bacterium]|nr:peptide deformylase [Actinomycetota bacterium]
MRALAQIRQYPDPALRLPAREVEVFDGDLASLVGRMRTLMSEAHGVGLAANQVGVLRRVLVFTDDPAAEPVALVNPRIVERSEELGSAEEGCLSLQGVRVPVERNLTLTVEARVPDGSELRLELAELRARVLQHELDHLDGVLILDRTTRDARREALGILRPYPVLGALS